MAKFKAPAGKRVWRPKGGLMIFDKAGFYETSDKDEMAALAKAKEVEKVKAETQAKN